MGNRKQEDQRIVDLGHDILKDSKRRVLYYDEKTKKGYQINPNDLKWVRFYKMRLFIAIFVYFLLFLALRNSPVEFRFFVSLISAIVIYFIIQFAFEFLFFKDKIPFKINQKDFEQRYELDVLKHKRLLQIFHIAFIIIYGLLALIDLSSAKSPTWIIILSVLISIVLAIWILTKIIALNSQIKLTKN